MAKSDSVWKGTPDKTAPGFKEKDYKESLKPDPPKTDMVGKGSESIGPNDPGYGR